MTGRQGEVDVGGDDAHSAVGEARDERAVRGDDAGHGALVGTGHVENLGGGL